MTIRRLVQISDLATTAIRKGHLPVSPSTCWRWVKEGRLPTPFKLGPGTTVWDLDEVEAAIAGIKAKRTRKESGVA